MELSSPHLLTKLPRSSRPGGSVSFARVTAVRGGITKHRNEICAAIHGDSLTLYNVRDGSIIISHPVPPTSSFSGPPLSVYSKDDDGNILRRTYCAIKRDTLHLQAFEIVGSDSQKTRTYTSLDLPSKDSPIILLQLVPSRAHGGYCILALQRDGTLSVFSNNLQQFLFHATLWNQSTLNILDAQCLSSAEASGGVLEQRSDLLNSQGFDVSYLALAYSRLNSPDSKSHRVFYGLWPIDTNGPSANQTISPLFEHNLGLSGHDVSLVTSKSKTCTFRHHARYLDVQGSSFQVFNLSGIRPVRTNASSLKHPTSQQTIAITKRFAISSSQDTLRLWDLEFETTQAYVDLQSLSRKRKLNKSPTEAQSGEVELVGWYHKLGRVVGRRRHQLLAIDISSKDGAKNVLTGVTRLVDNIGKVVSGQDGQIVPALKVQKLNIGSTESYATASAEWRHNKRHLDQLVQAGSISQFENTFIGIVRSELSTTTGKPQQAMEELPTNQVGVPTTYIDYVLSSIFDVRGSLPSTKAKPTGEDNHDVGRDGNSTTSILRIKTPAIRLILWLSRIGSLSTHRVNLAMFTSGDLKKSLSSDAVSQALIEFDPSLNLLSQCIENGFSPYIDEQSALVRILIGEALSGSTQPNQSTLVEGQDFEALERPVQSPWMTANVKRALVLVLNRFGAAATSVISSSLRADLGSREALALIQFLRQQLFQGGHTRSVQSQTGIDIAEDILELDALVRILSSCIDAIGPLGFFGTMENEDFVETIIPDLVSEIESTRKGLDDATDALGILREILRHQESIQTYQEARSKTSRAQRLGEQQKPGTILTLYSEGGEGEENEDSHMLPLNPRAGNLINPFKVRKGGGQVRERSHRHMGMLEQRQKGVYSFERLEL